MRMMLLATARVILGGAAALLDTTCSGHCHTVFTVVVAAPEEGASP